jgi:uncharacterized protein (TIGR04255 family)
MSKTMHPTDISLDVSPLGEAWLEVRWKLQAMKLPGQAQDPDFPFALGPFYKLVGSKYKYRKDLDASRAPLDIFPYVVRHQFWVAESVWPVLQLGPGVATVNFTKPYTWSTFRTEAQFLIEKLVDAYNGALPPTESITLRYQNFEKFDFLSLDILSFLSSGLNTEFRLPRNVPGAFASKPFPTGLNLQVEFELADPPGKATIMIRTGARGHQSGEQSSPETQRVAVWQFDLASRAETVPALADLSSVMKWLDSAHTAIHEWFFSFVDGKLLSRYGGKKK